MKSFFGIACLSTLVSGVASAFYRGTIRKTQRAKECEANPYELAIFVDPSKLEPTISLVAVNVDPFVECGLVQTGFENGETFLQSISSKELEGSKNLIQLEGSYMLNEILDVIPSAAEVQVQTIPIPEALKFLYGWKFVLKLLWNLNVGLTPVELDELAQKLVGMGMKEIIDNLMKQKPPPVEDGGANRRLNACHDRCKGWCVLTGIWWIVCYETCKSDFCWTFPPTPKPTSSPTMAPTTTPTTSPTQSPTSSPTTSPTTAPTTSPTTSPSQSPTSSPTTSPTTSPTQSPTTSPTTSPTQSPTSSPTTSPTVNICGNNKHTTFTFKNNQGNKKTQKCKWLLEEDRNIGKCNNKNLDAGDGSLVWETCPDQCTEYSGCASVFHQCNIFSNANPYKLAIFVDPSKLTMSLVAVGVDPFVECGLVQIGFENGKIFLKPISSKELEGNKNQIQLEGSYMLNGILDVIPSADEVQTIPEEVKFLDGWKFVLKLLWNLNVGLTPVEIDELAQKLVGMEIDELAQKLVGMGMEEIEDAMVEHKPMPVEDGGANRHLLDCHDKCALACVPTGILCCRECECDPT